MDWEKTLTAITKAGVIATTRMMIFTLLGAAVNIVCFLILIPETFAAETSFALRAANFVLFLFVWPFLGFILTKKYAIQKAIFHIYEESGRENLINYIAKKINEKMSQKGSNIKSYFEKFDNMPRALRWVSKFIFSQSNLGERLTEELEKEENQGISEEKKVDLSAKVIAQYVEEEWLQPSLLVYWILLAIAVAGMIAIKVAF